MRQSSATSTQVLPPEDRADRMISLVGKVLPTLMNWAVAALVAYLALSDRMGALEAGAGLAVHRIVTIERQVEELARDGKRTLENTIQTRALLEGYLNAGRRR